jgi:6-pyruvoyltetrahydropterin/6-carboxytetrahydropterin synthase
MQGLGRYYELYVTCRGEPDAQTGYFLNIKEIDSAVREHVLPHLQSLVSPGMDTSVIPMGQLMQQIIERLQKPLNGSVIRVRLALSPFYQLHIRSQSMSQVILRQQYEFAAAHRLHVPELSQAENQRVFGKCNNPSGHGHNYQVEVAVRCPIDGDGHIITVAKIDELVDRVVLERLDHKHLNEDVPAFVHLNPSVENITKVIYDWLAGPVKDMGLKLEVISVWETGKTRCSYPAGVLS